MTHQKRKRSAVWAYFDEKEDAENVAVCRLCSESKIQNSGNTTNMFAHLRVKHPEVYMEVQERRSQEALVPKPRKVTKPKPPRVSKKTENANKGAGIKLEVNTGLSELKIADAVTLEVMIPVRLGFIGCGNMAQALLSAFTKKGLADPHHTIASAPSDRNLSKLREMGVKTTHDNNEVVKEAEVVLICVKPNLLTSVMDGLLPLIDEDHSPLFISVVTGVEIAALEEMLLRVVDIPRVVRCMPNTPSTVSEGCCLYVLGTHTNTNDAGLSNTLLSSVGLSAEIPENQMDAACGLAGSGPAYIFAAIEALADGGVKMGLPRHLALILAAQTVKGAATMVLETGKHPGQLKDEVCSPSGTTIAAMHCLEKHSFRSALISAVETSAQRSKELGAKK